LIDAAAILLERDVGEAIRKNKEDRNSAVRTIAILCFSSVVRAFRTPDQPQISTGLMRQP
jgi:hypothetical protein